jgi:pimeloyl-ACP methyl ester carboxylesterase
VLVDGLPMFHRWNDDADADTDPVVHVHGFGISGTYLEPTAALLAAKHRTYVPDLPGMGRSVRPVQTLDIPGLASALVHYLDAVGIERATFVGNSLGCPIILEVASAHRQRIGRAVLVSPAGGPNNQPLPRALRQMVVDSTREPLAMLPIAVRDYLHFGVLQGLRLFAAMTRYPTLERIHELDMPTLVITGRRDPLVRHDRILLLAEVLHVDAARVAGAHALNFSRPQQVADLIDAFLNDEPVAAVATRHPGVEVVAARGAPQAHST